MNNNKLFASLMLLVVACFWGMTFPLIKSWANDIDASLFVALRFSIGAIILLPFLRPQKLCAKQTIMAGFILGLLNSGVYNLQVLALGDISASRCAFLTGTVVLWVPIFRKLLFRENIKAIHTLSGAICLLGLWILTGASWESIQFADCIMLVAEAFFALSLMYIERTSRHNHDVFTLTFYQIIFTCLIPVGISTLKIEHSESLQILWHVKPIITILFCGIFATALSLLLQVKYQPSTNSEYAALIYATEPLWASLFASLFFHEGLTRATIIGGGLMLVSMVLPELKLILMDKFYKQPVKVTG